MWLLYGLIPKIQIVDSLFVFGTMVFGFFGVEVFFVLSGFLIGSIFIKEIVSQSNEVKSLASQIGRFWIKRWFRTLPNYYLFVLLYLLTAWLLSSPDMHSFSWKYLLFIQNFFCAGPGFFYVAWSLAVEEWFYLILPVLFVILLTVLKDKVLSLKITAIAFFLVPFVLRFIYVIQHSWFGRFSEAFNLTTIYRLDSIAYGIALAWLWSLPVYRQQLIVFKKRLLISGLISFCLLLLFLFVFVAKPLQNGFYVLVSYPWASLSIAICFPFMIDIVSNEQSYFQKAVTFISKISYSLYLIHPLVLYILDFWIKKSVFRDSLWVGLVSFLLILSISIFSAHLFYRFWEMPFLAVRDKLIDRLRI
jgi:peptidoglycan/LPS O-acetylase OafA/YrhL